MTIFPYPVRQWRTVAALSVLAALIGVQNPEPGGRPEDNPISIEFGAIDEDDRRLVRFTWSVPSEDLKPGQEDEKDEDPCKRFELSGEALRDKRPFESFRYEYYPGDLAVDQSRVWFVFERTWLPGNYSVRWKLTDCKCERKASDLTSLTVPGAEEAVSRTAVETPRGMPTYPLVTHNLRIVPPEHELRVGKLSVLAVAMGDGIESVRFLLDGKPAGSQEKPPYRVTVDLGRAPRVHVLKAEALDGQGRVLAVDRIRINDGPHVFSVRITEPHSLKRYEGNILIRAEVRVPGDRTLDHVSFFLDDRKLATLFQEPFAFPAAMPQTDEPVQIRALAALKNGAQAEDTVIVNTTGYFEEVEVRRVTLWTGVVDNRSRPVTGLKVSDFEVFEDGDRQEIRQFAPAHDLPIHLVFLTDISKSMSLRIPAVVNGTRQIINAFVKPGDRAALMAFQDVPRMLTPFTDQSSELRDGLQRLQRESDEATPVGSAIYDSIVYALHYFGGIGGRRALLVFTDSLDNLSGFGLKDMMAFARMAEVRVYIIAESTENTPNPLEMLARDTGGGYYIAPGHGHLIKVLRLIEEELRSQYMIAFDSKGRVKNGDCNKVKVKLVPKKLEAKTIRYLCPQ